MKTVTRLWISLVVNAAVIIILQYMQLEGQLWNFLQTQPPCTQEETQNVTCPRLELPIELRSQMHGRQLKERIQMPRSVSSLQGTDDTPNNQHVPPTVYIITTTHQYDAQKANLVILCQTLMHVRSLVWIVVENSTQKSQMVKGLLKRCNIPSVHLAVPLPHSKQIRPTTAALSIWHHNMGLRYLREHKCPKCSGVVYFGNDDDRYDLKFFEEIRKTEAISVFMVGLTGGLLMEGPYCQQERVLKWHRVWGPSRRVPIEIQGFAINLKLVLEHENSWLEKGLTYNDTRYIDANSFISGFLPFTTLECRTSNNEVLVWRTKTRQPETFREPLEQSDKSIEF